MSGSRSILYVEAVAGTHESVSLLLGRTRYLRCWHRCSVPSLDRIPPVRSPNKPSRPISCAAAAVVVPMFFHPPRSTRSYRSKRQPRTIRQQPVGVRKGMRVLVRAAFAAMVLVPDQYVMRLRCRCRWDCSRSGPNIPDASTLAMMVTPSEARHCVRSPVGVRRRDRERDVSGVVA